MESKIKHLAIIMDGNRRWANSRGLPAWRGHLAGYKKCEEVLNWCHDTGIKILTLFAFSTENWQRAKKEVDFLMSLFYKLFSKDIKKFHKKNICLRVIGHKEGLSKKLQKAIAGAEKLTENNTGEILNLAINYGGRQELVDAFNKILKDSPKEINEKTISKNIYALNISDPDLIVRTSGEKRLSGFLLWQSAYSELCFINHHWPDFNKDDFNDLLNDFENRQRRFGK